MELETMVYKLHDKGVSLLCVLMKLLHVWCAGEGVCRENVQKGMQ